MIYYELNEANSQSKLPKEVIDHGKQFEGLERISGADFMVIPENGNYENAIELKEAGKNLMEIAKELQVSLTDLIKLTTEPEYALHEWLFSGAILVQRKSGFDFVASMGSRLNEAIARMNQVAHKQYQRIILVTGIFDKNGDLLTINGNKTEWSWSSFQGAVSAIKYKGALVEFVPTDNDILEWVKVQESQLLKYKRETTQWVVPTVYYPPDLPELDDPLQLMIPVNDARLSMVSIPGWGIAKINSLYVYVKQCLGIPRHPTLLELLIYATAWETANHLKGIGKGLIKNAREYVGLADGEYLFISNGNVTTQKETEE
jgi:hypothetical protein